jgi:ferredoxin
MSLFKAIEHGKEHRKHICHDGCRCERCRMNLLIGSVRRAPVDDEGKIIGNRSIMNAYKSMKGGVTKNYKG